MGWLIFCVLEHGEGANYIVKDSWDGNAVAGVYCRSSDSLEYPLFVR